MEGKYKMYPYYAVVHDDTGGTTVSLYEERVPSSDYRRIYRKCLVSQYFPKRPSGELSLDGLISVLSRHLTGDWAHHKSCVESVARAYATEHYGESFTRQIMVTFEEEDQYYRTHFSVLL
jgi:hypothetical protein